MPVPNPAALPKSIMNEPLIIVLGVVALHFWIELGKLKEGPNEPKIYNALEWKVLQDEIRVSSVNVPDG